MSVFHSLEIIDVKQESSDSVSLAFTAPDHLKHAFDFTPGQYLTLRADIGGVDCRRAYSLCSTPEDKELRIAIKQAPGGLFSTFANKDLKPGQFLDVMEPEGRFTLEAGAGARHCAFFVAGSGITPALSIIRTLLETEPGSRATLFYGNKTTGSIMFRERLEDLKDRYLGRLTIFHVLSRESQDIEILNGRLDREKIAVLAKTIVPPAEIDAYFLCGPYGMVGDARSALIEAGAEPHRVKLELFSTDGMAQPQPVLVTAAGDTPAGASRVECVLDGVTFHLNVRQDTHVVDAAHEQGVELPYSCKGGMCCTCRCKVAAGEVVMDVNYSLEPWEIEAGFVLACQTRPVSATVKLDFDAV